MRFLLDTNVLIPLQDTYQVLTSSLANFIRLANIGGHQLLYHPATVADFRRDPDEARRTRNLQRLNQYSQLDNPAPCPWNKADTSDNDACDNEILYALECDAVHALVTEDRGIHAKARILGQRDRVYTIQMAEDWLRRLHEPRQVVLPNIEDVPLHSLTPMLSTSFFNSLRDGYVEFDRWFREKAREDRRAWIYRDDEGQLAALCIYDVQIDEPINDAQARLSGNALKLCTFKVGETVRGRKIGELFLKAAFRFATERACENIFTHTDADEHDYLVRLLEDFGFVENGTYGKDTVLVKAHPRLAPEAPRLTTFEYARRYFPHYQHGPEIQKFIVPIQPQYHDTLLPDYHPHQSRLFGVENSAGNAIKLAYLCHAQSNSLRPGDLLLFYRTVDEMALTSIGVVENFTTSQNSAAIASLVSRRTVYSREDIEKMAAKPTKVILFRLLEHLPRQVSYAQLQQGCGVAGPIQSIRKIQHDQFTRILTAAGR
ncbi:MAG: GNAT family N-acetyltransferase [Sulfuritalea sp.]|nr:GNAT family N-acetyltransferase [Sulfuritalea sp.]